MSSHESITISPLHIDKVGTCHCVVPREGHVAVGGDTHEIDDEESFLFVRCGITVKRSGSVYTFSRD